LILARYLSGLPSLGVVAVSLGLCAIAYAPVGILQAPGHLPNARVLASLVVLGVICTAVAFVAFFHLIAEIGPVRATVITYINPAVAVALGVAFLGESFTAGTGFGFALILAGSFLATRRWDEPKPGAGRRLSAAEAAAPIAEP
jgi:drug/metabolite transporter (DMT)-like permease